MERYCELDNFLKLCRKAQEIIWDNLSSEKPHFFCVSGIDDKTVNLTPIEQIFYMATNVYYVENGISLCVEPQVDIFIGNKHYIADFVLTVYSDTEKEFELKKPLIIELDGKEYHSNQKQMNHDYQRENDLKLAGYDIMRFTGSQIYNDVYGCLRKVVEYIGKADKEKA